MLLATHVVADSTSRTARRHNAVSGILRKRYLC
jgi:hypothetical protein